MSARTITTLYDAFARLDADAMAACYAEDARFDDEAFSLAGRAQIGGMWRMLIDAINTRGRDVWRLEVSEVTDRSAHWEPRYRFGATGRIVHNVIDASFTFDAADRILTQRDRFDFWRWSRQALGPAGVALGWTPFLRAQVRRRAAASLAAYLARPRA
ncbi:MAG: nuclear transport factor 2 family protein [Burkholderiales bacterium]|nr:nuclear transport factor 2 family protein [Burkholderiales bacterium]